MLYHLNQSAVGLGHFFTLKIASEALGLKNEKSHNGASTLFWRKVILVQIWEKREKSQRCFISGLEKSHNGVDFSKCGSFVFWRKVILVQLRAPLWLFSQTKVEAPWWLFSFFSNLHQYDFSPEQNGKFIGRNVIMVLTFFFFEPYRGSRGLPLVFLDCFMYFFHFRISGVATYEPSLGPFFGSKEKKPLNLHISKSLLAPIWLFSRTLQKSQICFQRVFFRIFLSCIPLFSA